MQSRQISFFALMNFWFPPRWRREPYPPLKLDCTHIAFACDVLMLKLIERRAVLADRSARIDQRTARERRIMRVARDDGPIRLLTGHYAKLHCGTDV